jgi:hypothetical protein
MRTRSGVPERLALLLALSLPAAAPAPVPGATDPLPSWRDTAPKKAILSFVERVTRQGSRDFVPPSQRIATFDNDGTLWAEQPTYVQLAFALDRVKVLAPQHPEWKTKEPFASLLKGDVGRALAGGEKALTEVMAVTHTGMTTEEFAKTVSDWISTAKHPKTGKLHTQMVYQPMLELLAYLRGTASRPTSSPAAASSSCGPGWRGCTASLPPRWWAAAASSSTRCARGSRSW